MLHLGDKQLQLLDPNRFWLLLAYQGRDTENLVVRTTETEPVADTSRLLD